MAQSRSERNPRTSRCARYAVRGLAVAGFAGVAWLLSASAAHASDGLGDFGGADQRFGLLSPVTSLLTGVTDHGEAQHERQDSRGGRDLVTSTVLTILSPVAKVAAPTNTAQAAVQTVDASVRAVHSATADASSVKRSSDSVKRTSPKRPAKAGIPKTHAKRTQEPAVQAVPVGFGSGGTVTTAATGTFLAGVDRSGAAVRSRAVDRRNALHAMVATHEKPVVDRTVAQGTHHVPLLPRPAPVPAPPAAGLASGAPSTGSGLNHDGGAAATLPAVPAGAKVFTFRPDAVEDVELRLLAAEKPTVSPD